ncbi:hypothetical protein [uncultured Dialister sp.]|uniref:hypothetical protein n=1 Tax=uncultured Dialister sp. TaxID=278064 RepID=UPI0026DA9E98|nr:hypothetical protein [uncultured Dialister sp.]
MEKSPSSIKGRGFFYWGGGLAELIIKKSFDVPQGSAQLLSEKGACVMYFPSRPALSFETAGEK